MTDKRIVITALGTEAEATDMAWELCERKLAACVNIIPNITSIYHWKGEIQSSKEWMLVIKTSAALFENVREAIRELHPYEIPECIELPIERGSTTYLNWIGESVEAPQD